MRLFAHFISFLFNPLVFMMVAPYLVVFSQTYNIVYSLKWQVFTAVFILVIVVLFLIGKWRGIFSDYDISKREERPKLFFLTLMLTLIYLIVAIFFKGIYFPISLITFAICVAIVAFTIVNYRLKASGHVAVACAFAMTLGLLYGQTGFVAIVWTVPLLAWARVFLKRHTIHEVVTGAFLGTGITLLTFLLGKYIFT